MLFAAEVDAAAIGWLAQWGWTDLLLARLQMVFTLMVHISLACLGVGMPVLMLAAEWRYLRTGDEVWRTLARRWSKAFLVLFAVGAATGTVLSFELGMFWPNFMGTFGPVIALPFTLEGFAFFVEAIFGAIYLYGWDRLPKVVHWWTGVPIALAGAVSAWFVVTAAAWMNCPQGFELATRLDSAGQPAGLTVVDVRPFEAMLNPATGPMTTHMILAAYMVTGFGIAGYYALSILRRGRTRYAYRAMLLGLLMGAVCAVPQAMVGHWAGQRVAHPEYGQPVKFAAMEGHFETEQGAALILFGIPDEEAGVTRFAIRIPKMLSFLAYNDFHAEVKGLNDFDRSLWPPVAITHIAFQIMVGAGGLLILVSLWAALALLVKRRLPRGRLFLAAMIASAVLAWASMQAGWFTTEVGRQPWIVHNVMRTSEAVTEAPGIGPVLLATLVVYLMLTVGGMLALRLLGRIPLPAEAAALEDDASAATIPTNQERNRGAGA